MKVLLIDDEPKARIILRELLSNNCPQVTVVGDAEGVESGLLLIEATRPDLVFLDIRMKDGTGFDLLDQLNKQDFQLIFTTAYDSFALKAFEYNAIDYLLKPIDPEKLVKAVNKIKTEEEKTTSTDQINELLKNIQTKTFERISLSTAEGLRYFKIKHITRLEASNNYTTFFTSKGDKVMVSKTIGGYEKILPNDLFFRVHQSHIVNFSFVEQFLKEDGGYALMEDGSKIPVSRRKKDGFIKGLEDLSL